MPKVSVILLSYNQGEYLRESVQSVLDQAYGDWELLVIDNGSSDDSHAILEAFRSDPRIRLFLHSTNEPPTRRLNQGVVDSRGEYVSLLYSDDYYLPQKLAHQVPLLDAAAPTVGLVYSPGNRLNVSTGETWQDLSAVVSGNVLRPLLDALCGGGYVNPIAPLIRRECFLRYPFHEDIFIEGECIFLHYAMSYHFLFDALPTVVMRDHERNVGRSVKKNMSYFFASLEKLERHPDFPQSAHKELKRLRIRGFRTAGWQGVRLLNEGAWARSMFVAALRADSFQITEPKVIAGLGLSLLPDHMMAAINRSIASLRRSAGHTNYVP